MRTWLPLTLSVAVRVVVSAQGRRRALLLVLVGTLSSLCVLATFATAALQERESARASAMAPVLGDPPGFGGQVVFSRPEARETGWTELEHDYRGDRVTVVRVSDPFARGPFPPGLDRWPRPGEVLVSPALARLLDDDDGQIRQWFAGSGVAVLPHVAVGSAGQLLAYLGVAPEHLDSLQGPLEGFGSRPAPGFGWYTALGCMLFLVMPAFVLVLTASRFGRPVRAARYQALRLLGVPVPRARLGSAAETALPVAAGALTGALVWPLVLPDMFALPVTGRWLFGSDLRVPLWQAALTVVGVAVVAGVFGAATVSGGGRGSGRGVRFLKPVRLTSPLVAVLFALGLVLVSVAYFRHRPRDPLLWLSVVMLGAGLPSVSAWTGQRLARLLGRVEAGLVWLLASRRLAADAQSRFRVAGMIGIAVFAVGASQPVSQVLAQPHTSWVAQARADGQDDLLARVETLETVPLRLSDPPPVVQHLVPSVALWGSGQEPGVLRPETQALVATCPQLEALFDQPLPRCTGDRMTLVGEHGTERSATGALLLSSRDRARQVTIPVPDATLTVPGGQDTPVGAGMVLPPDDPALAEVDDPFSYSAYLRVATDRTAWEAARAWVVASSPAYRLENSYQMSEVTDSTGSWVLLGLGSAAAVTVFGAVLTVVEDGGRRREWFGLRALGVARSRLTAVQFVEAAFTSVVAVALATFAAVAVSLAYLRINDDRLDTLAPFGTAAAAGAAAVVLTAALSSWITLRARK
ncbi:hypothetical protein [Streptomyces avicenniae]|uniref:hypothetical protein n=1 Tax=Streptomyces avicenniae TaxID=500153 RepID=UPI00069AA729|nr:hypothetical protein [Streptomyces avicenniae]